MVHIGTMSCMVRVLVTYQLLHICMFVFFFLLDIQICVLVPSKIKHSRIDLSVSSALKLIQICVLVLSAYSGVLCLPHVYLMSFTG